MNRIDRALQRLKKDKALAFIPYITAGDPDLETTADLVLELERTGSAIIELGVPFSDPLADGPDIQPAHQRALASGTTLRKILQTVKQLRLRTDVPIALMSYFNPIHHYGVTQLVGDAAASGVDGLIIPDLIPEEADDLIAAARVADLKTIFFIAPTSSDQRIKLANEKSTGYIYCVSLTGTTGTRSVLPDDVAQNLRRIRSMTNKPLVVGFGVSTPAHVKAFKGIADGAIVGSALVRIITANIGKPREEIVKKVGAYAAELAAVAR